MKRDTLFAIGIGIIILLLAILIIFGIIPTPLTSAPAQKTETAVTDQTMNQDGQLKIEDIEEGTGDKVVEAGDTIVIDYKGTLTDGTQFDSSYDRGEPFQTEIGVGKVIEGWDKGVLGMKVGGKRKLTIPPDMAYGSQALPGIPANSTLIFEVELVDILK